MGMIDIEQKCRMTQVSTDCQCVDTFIETNNNTVGCLKQKQKQEGEISISARATSATARKYFLNGFGSKHVRFRSKQYSFGSKHCFVYTFIFPYFFIFVHILWLYIVTSY